MSIEAPTIDEREIRHKEIADLEVPIKKIFKEILPNFERGDYDLIIGIDASGRTPALIMDKLMNYVYAQKGNSFITRFLAGKGSEDGANSQINEWNPQKKVLIVEDTILSGSSIIFLTNVLREKEIAFDIVAISGYGSTGITSQRSDLGAGHIYIGTSDKVDIYGERRLSGVRKFIGETFSEPYKKWLNEGGANPSYIQEAINEARSDADIVADHLIDWYEAQK